MRSLQSELGRLFPESISQTREHARKPKKPSKRTSQLRLFEIKPIIVDSAIKDRALRYSDLRGAKLVFPQGFWIIEKIELRGKNNPVILHTTRHEYGKRLPGVTDLSIFKRRDLKQVWLNDALKSHIKSYEVDLLAELKKRIKKKEELKKKIEKKEKLAKEKRIKELAIELDKKRQLAKERSLAEEKRKAEFEKQRQNEIAESKRIEEALYQKRVKLEHEKKVMFNQYTGGEHIFSLGIYHPWHHGHNPNFDRYSGLLLDLKNKNSNAIHFFYENIVNHLGSGPFAVAVIPSHSPSSERSGVHLIADKLTETKHWTNAADVIVRTKEIRKLSQGGIRNRSVHQQSMKITNNYLIKDKGVLLLDDITTSGNSLEVGKDLLMDAGAKFVICVAFGRTEHENSISTFDFNF
jgi:phosphoribosylpyrophosphate synthetase